MVATYPARRTAHNVGHYGIHRRDNNPPVPAEDEPRLPWRVLGEYLSGLAFGAGVLTVAVVTYAVGTALLL